MMLYIMTMAAMMCDTVVVKSEPVDPKIGILFLTLEIHTSPIKDAGDCKMLTVGLGVKFLSETML